MMGNNDNDVDDIYKMLFNWSVTNSESTAGTENRGTKTGVKVSHGSHNIKTNMVKVSHGSHSIKTNIVRICKSV